jgi:hypothetical protein
MANVHHHRCGSYGSYDSYDSYDSGMLTSAGAIVS